MTTESFYRSRYENIEAIMRDERKPDRQIVGQIIHGVYQEPKLGQIFLVLQTCSTKAKLNEICAAS